MFYRLLFVVLNPLVSAFNPLRTPTELYVRRISHSLTPSSGPLFEAMSSERVTDEAGAGAGELAPRDLSPRENSLELLRRIGSRAHNHTTNRDLDEAGATPGDYWKFVAPKVGSHRSKQWRWNAESQIQLSIEKSKGMHGPRATLAYFIGGLAHDSKTLVWFLLRLK